MVDVRSVEVVGNFDEEEVLGVVVGTMAVVDCTGFIVVEEEKVDDLGVVVVNFVVVDVVVTDAVEEVADEEVVVVVELPDDMVDVDLVTGEVVSISGVVETGVGILVTAQLETTIVSTAVEDQRPKACLYMSICASEQLEGPERAEPLSPVILTAIRAVLLAFKS